MVGEMARKVHIQQYAVRVSVSKCDIARHFADNCVI